MSNFCGHVLASPAPVGTQKSKLAAQRRLTDKEILDIMLYGQTEARLLQNGRAIESALLSKLQAEGDERRLEHVETLQRMRADYNPSDGPMSELKATALDAAIAALASAPVADVRATYTDPLSYFQEGQWWIKELDGLTQAVGATHDQKRAVAVVHHMLCAARQTSEAVCNAALEEAATVADKWATDTQRQFGKGGPASEIRALKTQPNKEK